MIETWTRLWRSTPSGHQESDEHRRGPGSGTTRHQGDPVRRRRAVSRLPQVPPAAGRCQPVGATLSAPVLANTGAARQSGVNGAAQEPVIAGAISARRASTAHPCATARGSARAVAANTEGRSTTGAVKAAAVPLVGAAILPGGAIAVPGAHERRVGPYALVITPARVTGPRFAVVRGRIRQAASRCR